MVRPWTKALLFCSPSGLQVDYSSICMAKGEWSECKPLGNSYQLVTTNANKAEVLSKDEVVAHRKVACHSLRIES